MDRTKSHEGNEVPEVGHRIFQSHDQRAVVRGLDADLGKISYFPRIIGFGIFDAVEDGGVVRGRGGAEKALPR